MKRIKQNKSSNSHSESGIIFPTIMFLLLFIAAIATGVLVLMKIERRQALNHVANLTALYTAKAGIARTAFELTGVPLKTKDEIKREIGSTADAADLYEDYKYSRHELWEDYVGKMRNLKLIADNKNTPRWQQFLNSAEYNVYISDEEAKININSASEQMLMALFNVLKKNNSKLAFSSEQLARDIVIFREKNRPFVYPDEIILLTLQQPEVPYLLTDISEEAVNVLTDYLTIYSSQDLVNINTASPEMLQAVLIGKGPIRVNYNRVASGLETAQATLDNISDVNKIMLTRNERVFNRYDIERTAEGPKGFVWVSSVYFISAQGLVNGRIARVDTVINVLKGVLFQVLYWHQEFYPYRKEN